MDSVQKIDFSKLTKVQKRLFRMMVQKKSDLEGRNFQVVESKHK